MHEASRQLIMRERRLFEEVTETDSLTHHAEEADKMAADYKNLEDLVLKTLGLSLGPGAVNVEALTSAVMAVDQEMEQDQQWKRGNRSTPSWRQDGWRELHHSTLCRLVEGRLDSPSSPNAVPMGKTSVEVDVNSMGRQLKEDLLLVVGVVRSCYPPKWDICNFYARLYHQTFSSRLRKIADFGLEDSDCTFLLRWVNEYYPGILRKPELCCDISAAELGKLLPEEQLESLEKQYLNKQQEELKTYIVRVLNEAEEKWREGEEPTKENGCYVSDVARDIIELVIGSVSAAEKIVGDLQKAQIIISQMADLIKSFQNFQNNIMKQKKSNTRPFIMANLVCIEHFMELLNKKHNLFQKDVQMKCLQTLTDMKESAHMFLLKPVHDVLKSKYCLMGTNEWLSKPDTFRKLLDSIDGEIQDLHGPAKSCHQELIGQLHQEVMVEYVRRLLKGKVKLKNKEQQQKAHLTIRDNAESFQDLFSRMGSENSWLNEILLKIAEVLKLQDLPAIQMEVVSLGTAFPDLSEKHVSALLKLKTNISKVDRKAVKETLSDNLKDLDAVASRPFFSRVQVK